MKGVILDMASLKPDDLDLASLEALPVSWTYYDNTAAAEVMPASRTRKSS